MSDPETKQMDRGKKRPKTQTNKPDSNIENKLGVAGGDVTGIDVIDRTE